MTSVNRVDVRFVCCDEEVSDCRKLRAVTSDVNGLELAGKANVLFRMFE